MSYHFIVSLCGIKTWVVDVSALHPIWLFVISFVKFAVFSPVAEEKLSLKALKLMGNEKLLDKLYYTIEKGGSLASLDALYHAAKKKNKKITRKEVKEWSP